MRGAVLAVAAASIFSTPALAELGRDDQWTYVSAAGPLGPMAELRGEGLDGAPTELIFQIECRREQRALIFRCFPEYELSTDQATAPFALILDDDVFRMPRQGGDGALQRRLVLNADIVAAVRGAEYVMIGAPNEMDEAFHAGEAPALRQVTAECWSGSGS